MPLNSNSWKSFVILSICFFLILTLYTFNSYYPHPTLTNYWKQLQDVESEIKISETFTNSITPRLEEAEKNWKRGNVRRRDAVDSVHLDEGVDTSQARVLWDFFYPSFDCPFTKERIGRVGDGGKWICGFGELVTKSNCLVYSFGVRDDTSFEEEILQRTQHCIVRMFDPTIGSQNPSIVNNYPGRAFFHPIGISGDEFSGNMQTLKQIMSQNQEVFVHVLKMDVEGAEWESMKRILLDFPDKLPFAQLQIEVHLNNFSNGEWLTILSNWWNTLEESGLRAFFREPNLLNAQRYEFREIAFLNVKVEPFII